MAGMYPHVKRGIAFALIGGVCWGFSANCAEVLMGEYGLSVEWLTCLRLLLPSVVFLILAFITQRTKVFRVFKDASSLIHIVAFALLGLLLTQVSYLYAIGYAGAGPELLIEQLGMVIIMLYVCLRVRRFPYLREVLALICALLGVLFVSTQGDITTLNIPALGLIWGLISALSLFFYNVLPVRPLQRYGSFTVTGFAMLFSGIVACILFRPWETEVVLPTSGWVIVVAIVVVGSILAYMFFIQGIKDAGPVRTGILGSVEPISGIVISALWLHTPISLWDILGLVFIVAMIVLITQRVDSDEAPEISAVQDVELSDTLDVSVLDEHGEQDAVDMQGELTERDAVDMQGEHENKEK